MEYKEPQVSFLVLDFQKEIESYLCLKSIKKYVKFPYKVIYLHNGKSDYCNKFYNEGLVDTLINTKENQGLGISTRDLIAICQSEFFIYLQNDQYIARDFLQEELNSMLWKLNTINQYEQNISSISLAGSPCGKDIYSERCHIMRTRDYKKWEDQELLGHHGAGPYHEGEWREAQIQKIYKEEHRIHYEWPQPLVADNGVFAVRENKDKSIWAHRTDLKSLFNIVKPTEKNSVYPKFTDEEWNLALGVGWPDGKIPESELPHSFECWGGTFLAQNQVQYIENLRKKYRK